MTKEDWDKGGEEVKSNWFKFESVGDFIKGTLLSKRLQEGQNGYQDQWIYEIQTAEGVFNTPVSASKKGTCQRLNNCQVGDIVGIKFEKEGEAKPGKHPAKYLEVKTWGKDPEFNEFDEGDSVNPEVPEM